MAIAAGGETKQALGAIYERARQLPPLDWAQVQAIGESARYRRLRITGEFVPAFQVWLDNRVHQGRAGYHLILPLRLDRAPACWSTAAGMPPSADRVRNCRCRRRPGVRGQTLEGILIPAQSRYLELAHGPPPSRSGRTSIWIATAPGSTAGCRTGCCCRPRRPTMA
jgi:surfeit locus 1 family protein